VRVVAAVLGCCHTGRLEAKRSVERECAIELGNGEGYYINARSHQLHSRNHRRPFSLRFSRCAHNADEIMSEIVAKRLRGWDGVRFA
jgi:hypothetical protein